MSDRFPNPQWSIWQMLVIKWRVWRMRRTPWLCRAGLHDDGTDVFGGWFDHCRKCGKDLR